MQSKLMTHHMQSILNSNSVTVRGMSVASQRQPYTYGVATEVTKGKAAAFAYLFIFYFFFWGGEATALIGVARIILLLYWHPINVFSWPYCTIQCMLTRAICMMACVERICADRIRRVALPFPVTAPAVAAKSRSSNGV